jgi:hypothetical protein
VTLSDPTKNRPGGGPVSLQALLEVLGPSALDVLLAPAGLDVGVRGTAIFDAVDPVPDGRDSMLILVGTRADSPDIGDVVGNAADHGFVALVGKLRGCVTTVLLDAARQRGLAVLATPDDVPWRHLDGLLVSVLGSGGLSDAGVSGAGDTLFALANALGAIIGGSVAIEDLAQHVLAYSSVEGQQIDPLRERGILDRRVPDYPHHRRQYLQVLQSAGITRFPPVDDELARAAVAIRAGDMPLGTIWAIEGDGGLTPEGERALLDGVKVAALHMLREQDVGERERHLRGEVLRSMLAGTRTTEDGAERLGLSPGARAALVGFATTDPDPTGTVTARVGHAVSPYAAAYRPEVAITTTPHSVYAVVPGNDDGVRRFAEGALASASKATGAVIQAAMTASVEDLDDLATLRGEVDAVLGAAMADERAPAVAAVADVHTRLLLDRVGDQLARDPRLRHPEVQRMTEHDQERGTDYGLTVLAWLESFNDIGAAASRLQVHPNTLRYRLRRIEEKFGLDFTDPESRLSAWLQLRMIETRLPVESHP